MLAYARKTRTLEQVQSTGAEASSAYPAARGGGRIAMGWSQLAVRTNSWPRLACAAGALALFVRCGRRSAQPRCLSVSSFAVGHYQ